ncbi:winged helix-turn-helix domain-containing protein [Pseudoalteromonas viridis]|uniref:Winged helix-turn-helix domain-containing protein n=1 Tax=Pseudoalteromonas viridis TaxID=339617 RepID=A0ABX7V456_9GAMM|nr:winged helix-turn-helix domain-containing protein [Pseudoalteromonas viridis]QTL35668.1 winged helix-turn-helix domain-containing protein [Pseudoalteromonas viridis]
MAEYRFLSYRFDCQTHTLKQGKQPLELRPKAAKVLCYLLQNANTVVTKQEIINAVWGHTQVQDHRLFQLISELRKLAPEQDMIRTFPNQGYCWQVKTTVISSSSSRPLIAMAASVTLILTAVTSAYLGNLNPPAATSAMLPALSAYHKAIVAFEQHDYAHAQQWLTFSLQENPDSVEAQLLMAETLLQLDETAQAQHYASQVVQQSPVNSYYFSQAADVLSRLYASQARFTEALDFAIQGQQAIDEQAICSAVVMQQRIADLILAQPAPLHSPTLQNTSVQLLTTTDTHSKQATLCKQLTQPGPTSMRLCPASHDVQLGRERFA